MADTSFSSFSQKNDEDVTLQKRTLLISEKQIMHRRCSLIGHTIFLHGHLIIYFPVGQIYVQIATFSFFGLEILYSERKTA